MMALPLASSPALWLSFLTPQTSGAFPPQNSYPQIGDREGRGVMATCFLVGLQCLELIKVNTHARLWYGLDMAELRWGKTGHS